MTPVFEPPALLTTLTTIEPPAGTVTGKWSQAPALNELVRLAVLGPLPSSTVMSSRRRGRAPVDRVQVERAGVGGGEGEPQPDLGGVVPGAGPALALVRALERAHVGRRRRPGGAGPGALLEGVADARGQDREVGARGLVPGGEHVAVGAVVADPVALDAGPSIVNGGGGGGGGCGGRPGAAEEQAGDDDRCC